MLSILLSLIFPKFSSRMPSDRTKLLDKLSISFRGTATEILDKTTKENENGSAGEADKSILGTLGEHLSLRANNGLLKLNNILV